MAELFLTFAKIGLFTFGGGYAMIAIIENTCCERKGWITHEEMMDLIVVAESTPGPIAINCASYVGYKRRGIPGAVAATLGMVLPSFLIIYAISLFLDNFLEITVIAHAFRGIKIGVGILILNAGINMLKKGKKRVLLRGITICAFCAMLGISLFGLKFSSVTLMLLAGTVSLAVHAGKGGAGK